jgi:hypothetical protein
VIRNSGLTIVGAVVAVTVGLAAWKGASAETCAGVMLLSTLGVLMLSAIGAVCGSADKRPRFAGFAVFGWGYFALARWYSYHQGPLPTVCWLPGSGDIHNDLLSLPPAVRIAHDAWALALGFLGTIIAGLFFKNGSAREQEHAKEISAPGRAARWRRGPVFVCLLGFGLIVAAVLDAKEWSPEFGAGAAFLLTWTVMGLAVLGAVGTRGRRRDAWLGTAAFGIGYLFVAFSPVLTMALPTDHFLNAVFRPGGPIAARERADVDLTTDDESARVRRALHEPITLHFPESTSLTVVLQHIRNAIRGSLGKDLVLFVSQEPPYYVRLELDKFVVTIDRANIPAEDALRLCLGQIGMTYRVQSGYVRIITDAYQPLPFEEDPVMIAGHSLLALCAAGFGSISALLVAGLLGRHNKM